MPEPLLASAVRFLIERIDLDGSTTDPNHAFLYSLLPTNRAWNDICLLVLCLGLVSKDSTVRGVAVDVLIVGIDDGRAHPMTLAPVLARISAGGWLKRNRLASSLDTVARTSVLHAVTVSILLEQFMQALGTVTSGDLPLLELLHEQSVALGRPVDRSLCTLLAPLKGKNSKTGMIAQRLLGESTHRPARAREREEVFRNALEKRLERATRLMPCPQSTRRF